MWRTPEWKLICDFLDRGKDELYHLAQDPRETTNLIDGSSAEIRSVKKELGGKLLSMMHQIGDPLAAGER